MFAWDKHPSLFHRAVVGDDDDVKFINVVGRSVRSTATAKSRSRVDSFARNVVTTDASKPGTDLIKLFFKT
jgi:hypothetical protein